MEADTHRNRKALERGEVGSGNGVDHLREDQNDEAIVHEDRPDLSADQRRDEQREGEGTLDHPGSLVWADWGRGE